MKKSLDKIFLIIIITVILVIVAFFLVTNSSLVGEAYRDFNKPFKYVKAEQNNFDKLGSLGKEKFGNDVDYVKGESSEVVESGVKKANGVLCSSHSECQSDVCYQQPSGTQKYCRASNLDLSIPCLIDRQCKNYQQGVFCDSVTNKCALGFNTFCSSNAECGTGTTCIRSRCKYSVGESCTHGQDCTSESCLGGMCRGIVSVGGTCSMNEDCKTNNCQNGICNAGIVSLRGDCLRGEWCTIRIA